MKPIVVSLCLLSSALCGLGSAQADREVDLPHDLPCCEYPLEYIVWSGSDSLITIEELAAYCGPILWFSPDEPLLRDVKGPDIRIPTTFPFETPVGAPVVHYRVRKILRRENHSGEVYLPDPNARSAAVLNLNGIAGIDLDYFFYYPSEEGFGRHLHDVEAAEMKVGIWKRPQCDACPFAIVIATVNCKAHGVLWYDNTLDTDEYTRFPITVLVEEGKHASCTDKNGDGYYTPGYDVNRRINDAWGVRDVIRGGGLFTGGYQSWFTKVRSHEHRIFPPLPEDSSVRHRFVEDGEYASDYAQYQLLPFPHPDQAKDDPTLVPFIADKGDPNWPELTTVGDLKAVGEWIGDETFLKSLGFALRMDGRYGVAAFFPLLIVRHVPDPVAGGWLVNRFYLMDEHLRDFGWTILYARSASRWLDGYFSVGFESDRSDDEDTRRFWVAESGFKIRADLRHAGHLSFLSKLTDFWGVRTGLQATGLLPVERFRYVIEVGAGEF
jgi:hypothetical protein